MSNPGARLTISGPVRRWLPGVMSYFNSTVAMAIGLGSQLVSFAFLARFLGVDQFGELMTITAATALAQNICGLGSGESFMRRVGHERALYPRLLGHAVLVTLATGAVLVPLVMVVLALLPHAEAYRSGWIGLTVFCVSNIVIYRWLLTAEQIFLGLGRFGTANVIVAGFGIARVLVTVIATYLLGVDRLDVWAWWHGAVHLLWLAVCGVLLWPLGRPKWTILRDELVLGTHFCTSYFFSTLAQNTDRLVLSAYALPAVVGNYGLATRIINASVLTVNAFMRLRYPAMARAAQGGADDLRSLSLRYVPPMLGLGVLTSLGLAIIAPYLPAIFGKDYGAMVHYLQIGCWLIVAMALVNIPYDALGASARHGLRAWIVNIGGVVSVGVLVALTAMFGVMGTFAALFLTQIGLGIALWVALFRLRRTS